MLPTHPTGAVRISELWLGRSIRFSTETGEHLFGNIAMTYLGVDVMCLTV